MPPFQRIIYLLQQRLEYLGVFPKPSQEYSIDQTKKKEFLRLCNASIQHILEKIIDNTVHISFESLFHRLTIMVDELFSQHEVISTLNFFLGEFDNEDIEQKSNHWIMQIVKDIIKEKYPRQEIKFNIVDKQEIQALDPQSILILPDDCMYSGEQMLANFEAILAPSKVYIYIFVPYMSSKAWKKIQTRYKSFPRGILRKLESCWIFDQDFDTQGRKVWNIDDVVSEAGQDAIRYFYSFLFWCKSTFLLYFDHKIADTCSTVTFIYLGLIANEHNRVILKELQQKRDRNENFDDLKKKLQYLNFIRGCSETTCFDGIHPTCPPPPYKLILPESPPGLNQ